MTMALEEKPYYDTHSAFRRLINAGWPENQAEVLVSQLILLFKYHRTTRIDYDTHAAIGRLTDTGIPEPQAEAMVNELVLLHEYCTARTS